MSVFINATQAREDTRNNIVIHNEVRAIESAVLANVAAGVLYANVTSNTTMTDSNVYYNVYFNVTTDASKLDQINTVKNHFVDLDYGVSITEAPANSSTISWNISW